MTFSFLSHTSVGCQVTFETINQKEGFVSTWFLLLQTGLSSVTTKTVALVCKQLSKEKDFNLWHSPLMVALEDRFSLLDVAFIFYLLTRSIFGFVSWAMEWWAYFGAAGSVDLSAMGVIWNVKKADDSTFSLAWNEIRCPVLCHQKVACRWKARMFPRQRPGQTCSASHFFFHSCKKSLTQDAPAFKTWLFSW